MTITYGRTSYVRKGDRTEWTRHDLEVDDTGVVVADIYVLRYGTWTDTYRYTRSFSRSSA